jgi:tRNA nucleotidyltransferase/poly(A) polymerase
MKFYYVGGCVRDRLMGLTPKDIDIAVEAPSFEDMVAEIEKQGGEIFLARPQFFTVRARHPLYGCADFVLCRKDGFYSDGRRPDSVEMGTLEDDLARRDFTVNAIASPVDRPDVLIDPYFGAGDLKIGQLNAVGNPHSRLTEDPLRAFRAIRFVVRFKFSMGYALHNAMQALTVEDFKGVSDDRIREELNKTFAADSCAGLRWLIQFDTMYRLVFFERRFGITVSQPIKKTN